MAKEILASRRGVLTTTAKAGAALVARPVAVAAGAAVDKETVVKAVRLGSFWGANLDPILEVVRVDRFTSRVKHYLSYKTGDGNHEAAIGAIQEFMHGEITMGPQSEQEERILKYLDDEIIRKLRRLPQDFSLEEIEASPGLLKTAYEAVHPGKTFPEENLRRIQKFRQELMGLFGTDTRDGILVKLERRISDKVRTHIQYILGLESSGADLNAEPHRTQYHMSLAGKDSLRGFTTIDVGELYTQAWELQSRVIQKQDDKIRAQESARLYEFEEVEKQIARSVQTGTRSAMECCDIEIDALNQPEENQLKEYARSKGTEANLDGITLKVFRIRSRGQRHDRMHITVIDVHRALTTRMGEIQTGRDYVLKQAGDDEVRVLVKTEALKTHLETLLVEDGEIDIPVVPERHVSGLGPDRYITSPLGETIRPAPRL